MPSTDRQLEPERHPGAPVAVGGVGGSGTRLIAAILARLGFYMGNDFNPANDNLAFTLLFKHSALWPLEENREQIERSIRIFLNAMYFRQAPDADAIRHIEALAGKDRLNAPRDWLQERARKLIDSPADEQRPERWGWKEPNTHIFLPSLVEHIPDLRYIHVMRHGLDMAYSANQTQLQFWGPALTGGACTEAGPEESFRYWCAAHNRVLATGGTMGDNFLLLNFDEFCNHPETGMDELLRFLAVDTAGPSRKALLKMVKRPASIGRHLTLGRLNPAAEDIELLQELGFSYYRDELRNSAGQHV